jgi:hypothetical protein
MKGEEFCKTLPTKSGQAILNVGAGKEIPLNLPSEPYMLVNIDSGYYAGTISFSELLDFHKNYSKDSAYISSFTGKYFNTPSHIEFAVKEDIFRFMEQYQLKFDRIVMYRFLEHVKRTDVLYFIYLMATSLKIGGYIDCIVPNYRALANRILNEDLSSKDFEAEDIITTYELLNEPGSPHCSVWTPDRILKFFELEKRFLVIMLDSQFNFDGRDIYIRTIIQRT